MNDEGSTQPDVIMKLYTLYLKDLQSVGSRHENMRKYYLTLISAMFTILSLGGSNLITTPPTRFIRLISIFGTLLCLLWALNMLSYRATFRAKFYVMEDLEQTLPTRPFTMEKAYKNKSIINHFSVVYYDMLIASLFLGLFVTILILNVASN